MNIAGETLEELPLLEVLDLSWNAGLGGHLQLLAAQLRSGCRLKELHLVDCGLTAADVGAVGEALFHYICFIEMNHLLS